MPVKVPGIFGCDYLNAAAAPAVGDDIGDGYSEGSHWLDLTNDDVYTLVDKTLGAAKWGRHLAVVDGIAKLYTTEHLQFRDANTFLASLDVGHIDVAAVTSIDLNANVVIDGAYSLSLSDTTAAGDGVILKGTDRWAHNFHHPTGGGAVPIGQNTFFGVDAGNFTMGATATNSVHGSQNSGFGQNALQSLVKGSTCSAFGLNALKANTDGAGNSAFGANSLYTNTTGTSNSAFGQSALFACSTGSENSAFGLSTLRACSTGYYNTAIGESAVSKITTGHNNSACGWEAGNYTGTGADNQTSYESIYLGSNCKSSASGAQDEIVIGYSAVGQGSHTAVLGHTTITDTYLRGTVHGASFVLTGNITMPEDAWIGIVGPAERIVFDGSADVIAVMDAKFGIGTQTVPHGAVGAAKLALEGADASLLGPHVQFTTTADVYPLMQAMMYSHDNMAIFFDMFYDTVFRSSDAGSNFGVYKSSDLLQFWAEGGVAAGSQITAYHTAFQIEPDGDVMLSPAAALKTFWRDSAIWINSGADGYLDLAADVGIRFTPTGTAFSIYAGSDGFINSVVFDNTVGGGFLFRYNGVTDMFYVASVFIHYTNVSVGGSVGGYRLDFGGLNYNGFSYYNDYLICWPGGAHRHLVIADPASVYDDYNPTTSADPTLRIQSVTRAAVATNQWLSLKHDQTNGVVSVGVGAILLAASVVSGSLAALATNATDGFLCIPTCAGTPTGVPTAYTGKVAMVWDTTGDHLHIYDTTWIGLASELYIPVEMDNGGAPLNTGEQTTVFECPCDCVIVDWTLYTDVAATIKIDVWKDTYANYPPTNADTICGGAEPATAAANKATGGVAGWTTALARGDILKFNIDNNDLATHCKLYLRCRRT